MRKLILFVAVALFLTNAKAQLNFENFSSQNSVEDLLEDGNYIWVATTGGVFKRDKSNGQLVATYNTSNGLGSNDVQCMAMDLDGNIWFGTHGHGISIFNPNEGTWKQLYKNGFDGIYIYDIFIDSQGKVFVATLFNGILKYDHNKWTHYLDGSSTSTYFSCVFIDDIGNLWAGGNNALYELNINGDTIIHQNGDGTITNGQINAITEDNNGNVYFAQQSNGISIYNLSDETWSYLNTDDGLNSNTIYDITLDAHDNIWVATWSALSKYDGSNFTNYTEADGLAKNYVKCVMSDASGNIWAGTAYGLSKYNYDDDTFNTPIRSANSLIGNNVISMVSDSDGEMWFGTANGCSRYNPDTKKWKSYNTDNVLPYNIIWGLDKEDDSLIWIGAQGALVKYNKKKDQWSVQNNDYGWIWCVTVDQNHNKWVGTQNGFYKIDADNNRTYYDTADGLINNVVQKIKIDSQGNAWIGTTAGLSKFDGTSFTNYDNSNTDNVINYEVRDIFVDENDTIYVVPRYGLAKFDGVKWVKKMTSWRNNALLRDDLGNFWLGTSGYSWHALMKMKNSVGANYTVDNGLVNNDINLIILDNNKEIWVATSGGVSHITSQKPTAMFNYDTICYGSSNTITHLKNMSQYTDELTTYAWDINNDGIIDYTTKDLNYNFQHAGLFPVTLIVSNDLASDTIKQDVRVYENPEITLSPDVDQEICAGSALQFTATPTSVYRPIFVDPFNYSNLNASSWKTGGEGAENWSIVDTNVLNNSELYFYWKPEITGEATIKSPLINTTGADSLFLYFDQMLDFYADSVEIGVRTSSDGTNWNTVWELTVSSDIPAEQKKIIIKNSDVGSSTFYLQFYFKGRSYNLDAWHIDDVALFKTDVNTQYYTPYTYHWSNGARSRDIQVAEDGRYSVTVANRGCIYTSQKIRVKFIKPITPKICMVTVDTSTQKNLIVWEKPSTTAIDKFIIYREQGTNDYISIGEVAYDELSEFVDIGSSPSIHADKYKISIIDTCGNESELSPYHQTMNLSQAMGTEDNEVILIWNKYEDESEDYIPSTYNVYRKETGKTWDLETALTGSLSTFNYNLENVKTGEQFIVSIDMPTCTPTRATGGPYYQSTSNLEDEGISKNGDDNDDHTAINNQSTNDQIVIYPNPNNGYFTISFPKAATGTISLFNNIGQLVRKQTIDGINQWESKQILSSGVYLLKIDLSNQKNVIQKIIVQ